MTETCVKDLLAENRLLTSQRNKLVSDYAEDMAEAKLCPPTEGHKICDTEDILCVDTCKACWVAYLWQQLEKDATSSEDNEISEEKAKEILSLLKDLQLAGNVYPCPRCGRQTMKEDAAFNALSRYANVYICDTCGLDEAIRSLPGGLPIPLLEWGMIIGMKNYA